MGVVEDFKTWLTGRNGIYRDDDKIDAAKSELKTISSSKVDSLKDEVKSAVNNLNGQTGFEQYVGHLESSAFDSVIACTSTAVDEIINQIDQKVEEIDEYDSGNLLEKTIGTTSMLTGKLGEGFLSAFEGVLDTGITACAWVANVPNIFKDEDTSISKMFQSAAEADLSGALMSPLTSNALAKKYSLVTKDSGAASIVNGAGKALGYATMAGYLSGAARAYSGAAKAGEISNISRAAKAANVLKSTTNSTTLVAGISDFGQGTQTGLQSGNGLKVATLKGAAQGSTGAIIAYLGGRLGEKSQIKSRTTTVNKNADEMLKRGNISADRINTMRDKTIDAIQKEVHASGGYTDKVTMSALKKGESDMNTIINLKTSYGAGKLNSAKSILKGTGENLKNTATAIPEKAKQGWESVKNNFNEDSIAANLHNKVGKTDTHHGTWLGQKSSGVVRTITDPLIQPIKAGIVTETGKIATGSVARMAGEAALGATSNVINSTTGLGINSDIASNQFQARKGIKKNLNLTGTDDITFTPNDTKSQNSTSNDNNNDDNPTTTDNGQLPTPSPDGNSQQQFRHTTDDTSTSYQPTSPQNNPTGGTTAPTTTAPSTSSTTSAPTTPTTTPTTISPVTTAPTTTGPTTSITTPPSNGNGIEATTGSTNTIHTGGGYTGTSGYTSGTVNTTGNITDGTTDAGLGTDSSITGALTEGTTSIEDVIKGSKVTKIPTSPSPVTTTSSSSGSSAVIPIAAGLSAAAAAGIGAKAYMDRKHNNDNGEEDEDEFDTDEWSGDDSVDIQYDEDTANGENYLDDDDDYSYQATSNNEEKYDARSSDELADLQ